jgi:transglutaminase-like putative cysteine protease
MKRTLLVLALASMPCGAADEIPDWVRQAAAQSVPAYPPKVTSVVLLREETVTVHADGSRLTRVRGVEKILQPGGETVRAGREYDTRAGRIRDFQGWMIPPMGKPMAYPKNRVVDIALETEYVYDEARAKMLDFGKNPPGTVMAWEITEEQKTVFTQDGFEFQNRQPVLVSRFAVTLPASWESRGTIFNHAPVEPVVSGSTNTWELRNLPPIEREDFSPSISSLAPRLALSYFPPPGTPNLQGMKDWSAVSSWLSSMVDPPAEVTESIRAKARELTANSPGELARIAAIARFAQQTNYVEIALNVARGGGITPRPASDSLAKNYGDCKDKATLMRALLKAAGIDSYLTTITSGDRTYVRPEWASPDQFNHAIIAIRVSDAIDLPAVIPQSPVGRLLMFDPTSRFTPLGDLPESEQASYALVIAGTQGALLKMPLLPLDSRRVETAIDATMDGNGRLEARLKRQYYGQSGTSLRGVQRLLGNDDLKKTFERAFTRRVGGTTLTSVATEDSPSENRITVNVDLAAERFGVAQGKLLLVRPGLLSNTSEYFFSTRQRTTPIRVPAALRSDAIHIKVPAGFQADEIPPVQKLESPYGKLAAKWSVKNGELVMEQTIEISDTIAPAAEFPQVRDFFDRVAGVQSAPVVFVRQ